MRGGSELDTGHARSSSARHLVLAAVIGVVVAVEVARLLSSGEETLRRERGGGERPAIGLAIQWGEATPELGWRKEGRGGGSQTQP